jgi:hypothetical protein
MSFDNHSYEPYVQYTPDPAREIPGPFSVVYVQLVSLIGFVVEHEV